MRSVIRRIVVGAVATAALTAVAVVAGPAGAAAAGTTSTVVVPNGSATTEGSTNNGYPFGACGIRYQQVYAGAQVGSGMITAIAFRPDGPFGQAFSETYSNVLIQLSTTSNAVGALSATFADNIGSDVTTVHDGPLTLSSADTGPAGGPKDFDVVIPLASPFTFNAAAGNLLLDVTVSDCPTSGGNATLDAVHGDGGVSREVNDEEPSSPTAIPGDGTDFGLVTQFTETASDTTPPSLTLPPDQSALASSVNGAVVSYPAPSATDNVDGTITPLCDHASGDTFPLGTTTVTCTATDTAGNTSTGSFTVTVTYGPCDRTLSGKQPALTVTSGITCLLNANVKGGVSVGSGATLKVENSTVLDSISAYHPAGLRICGSTTGSIAVSAATGPVVIGNPPDCAHNVINGGLTATGNTGGGNVNGNKITGSWLITGNTPVFSVAGNHH